MDYQNLFKNLTPLTIDEVRQRITNETYFDLKSRLAINEDDENVSEFLHSVGFETTHQPSASAMEQFELLTALYAEFPSYSLITYIKSAARNFPNSDKAPLYSWLRTMLDSGGRLARGLKSALTLDMLPDDETPEYWNALTTPPLTNNRIEAILECSACVSYELKHPLLAKCAEDDTLREYAWAAIHEAYFAYGGKLDFNLLLPLIKPLLRSPIAKEKYPNAYNALYWRNWFYDNFSKRALPIGYKGIVMFAPETALDVLHQLRASDTYIDKVVSVSVDNKFDEGYVVGTKERRDQTFEERQIETFAIAVQGVQDAINSPTIKGFGFYPISKDLFAVMDRNSWFVS